MAAPNIVDVGTITGKTLTYALSSTSATVIANNTASSGKVFIFFTLNFKFGTFLIIFVVTELS